MAQKPKHLKPRVLIGSSVEGLPLARALQEQLEFDCVSRLWNENVFHLSRSALESLLDALDHTDFAILVVTPDDVARIREHNYKAARDNVLVEFALAVGRLGRERVFLVTPRDVSDLHLPTDLLGVEPASYFWVHGEDDWLAILGPAANRIRRALSEVSRGRPMVQSWGFFGDYASRCGELIVRARQITLYFIHSRRWRETHLDALEDALNNQCETIEIYLPNVANPLLRDALATHFDDGPFVPGLAIEGYHFWALLLQNYPDKIKVRLFDLYPTYSFYKFDSEVIVAMYPNTSRKKDVPTFQVDTAGSYWQFIADDLAQLNHKPPLTLDQIEVLVARKFDQLDNLI